MRLVPVVPNPSFHQQRHVNLASGMHNLDDFRLRGLLSKGSDPFHAEAKC